MILTKIVFQEGHATTALTCTTMVIIPEVGRGYSKIVLVEVIWKVCAYIVNNRL